MKLPRTIPGPLAVAAAVTLVTTVAIGQAAAEVPAVFLQGAHVFDGKSVVDKTNVLLIDGKIASIGPDITAPNGARSIDCQGRWVT
ncbi:MAG: hypothetical protein KDC95_22680, partial [Planctomycetes bacterium]|nr:hypothetical protein [Planctomycetota bacterium]